RTLHGGLRPRRRRRRGRHAGLLGGLPIRADPLRLGRNPRTGHGRRIAGSMIAVIGAVIVIVVVAMPVIPQVRGVISIAIRIVPGVVIRGVVRHVGRISIGVAGIVVTVLWGVVDDGRGLRRIQDRGPLRAGLLAGRRAGSLDRGAQ